MNGCTFVFASSFCMTAVRRMWTVSFCFITVLRLNCFKAASMQFVTCLRNTVTWFLPSFWFVSLSLLAVKTLCSSKVENCSRSVVLFNFELNIIFSFALDRFSLELCCCVVAHTKDWSFYSKARLDVAGLKLFCSCLDFIHLEHFQNFQM